MSGMHLMGWGGAPSKPKCSRAGCTADAKWHVNWRNPRIHDADRVKIWLACDEHRDYLYDYLAGRSFPVTITPVGVSVESLPLESEEAQ